MKINEIVTHTKKDGTSVSAKVIQAVGKGILISYIERGDVIPQVHNVHLSTLKGIIKDV